MSAKKKNAALYFFPAILTLFIALVALWQFTPLHRWIDLPKLLEWGAKIRGHRWTPFMVSGVYIAAGLVGFSHALMVWATAFTFPVPYSIAYCELGSFSTSLTLYGIGRWVGIKTAKHWAGTRWEKVRHALVGHNAILAIVVLHLFPLAPNNVLNLVCGACRIRFRDFIAGTFLGVTPGILIVCLFGSRLIHTIQHPNILDFGLLALFVVVAGVSLRMLQNRIWRSAGL